MDSPLFSAYLSSMETETQTKLEALAVELLMEVLTMWPLPFSR